MSARLGSTAPSPSIANLASKVINRLANNSINNINISNNNNNSNYTGVDEDEESGENEEYDDDAGIIRCICNFTDDDGFTIQCERCLVWQHAVCVGIVQSNVPDKYLCELCSPRPVDRKRANEIQRRRNGAGERKREKSPSSRRKSSVGRPRKQFGSAGGTFSEQGVSISKENGTHHSPGPSSSNGNLSKTTSGQTDTNGKRIRGTNTTGSSTSSSSHQNYSTKHKSAGQTGGSRISSATNEDDDLDMESDSQDDVSDAYQFEFSSVETNIVTSKAVQDLFRQVIAQFRQAQSRKRSLSLTSGVKLQELVASNSVSSNNSAASSHEGSDSSSTILGTLPPPPAPSTDASSVVSMERESLARPLLKTTVKHILPSSKSPHSPASQYGLFAEVNIGAGRFMMEFKGEVSLKSIYRSDPINQYSILATPKPFVLFHPQLDLAVDARRSGNDARFVRRSCVPNTEVKSIVVPGVQDQTVHLGLFAKVPIGKGQEITLDWNWNKDHLALQPIKATPEKSKDGSVRKSLKEIRKAKYLVASTLLVQTDCACENKDSCVLHQMLKDGLSEAGARDQESSTAAKGSRPKKVTSESLRQRYGGHRDRSGPGQDEKRVVDQDTSEEDLSMAENSPRRKSPKAAKLESSSKKARHESHTHHKTIRADQDAGSESDSDDHRRRKQNILDRQGSPLKRAGNVSQELSPREMKHALMLIKKMEDKDASQTGQVKQKSQEPGSKESRRSGIASPKPSKDKTKPQDIDQRQVSQNKTAVALEDDNISIGDSGIDSDSNSGLLRRDPFVLDRTVPFTNKRPQTTHSHGKRDRGQMEQNASSQSPATSDSERKDSTSRSAKRTTHLQPGKKQPYSTASRGKRIAEHAHQKQRSKDRVIRHGVEMMDDIQNLSGASSVEGSFVSIVGNTSDEEEEMSHRAGRRPLRDKNLPKETLPVASLKPSVLPCKKVWKMIYLKQRALAEEEAREKAEEMKKKAEEVFDLEMGEDETLNCITEPSTMSTETEMAPKVPIAEDLVKPTATPEPPKDISHQSSIIEGDVLNLFHDTVKPETSSSTASRNRDEVPGENSTGPKPNVAPKTIQQPVIIPPPASSRGSAAAAVAPKAADRPKAPQKLSLESYQARRLATNSTTQSDETHAAPDTTASAVVGFSAPAVNESMDVEMTEATPSTAPLTSEAPLSTDTAIGIQESLETKAEVMPSIPKVKLSLQEYQKKRQEASQRDVNPSVSDVPIETRAQSSEKSESGESRGLDQGKATIETSQEPVNRPVDVEMTTEDPSDNSTSTMEQDQTSKGDYFEVGTSLPTPLIGLSSRAQAVSSTSGDYFPVQPFSPISLSAGPTPFSKLNLTSSPPPPRASPSFGAQAQPNGTQPVPPSAKSPSAQRTSLNASPKETQGPNSELKSPGNKFGPSPPQSQGSAGWRTPRGHKGTPPPASGPTATSGSYRHGGGPSMSDHRPDARYYGAQQDRSERPPTVESLNSPTRERQHSVTSDNQPASPFEPSSSGHYGYNDDQPSFKRSSHLSSPPGHAIPTGPRDYFKPDERSRHRSINGDEWGYGNMDNTAYGGYRGPRNAPPPPPPRDRDRDRERDHERERERDRERRDRYERRDYFVSGPPGSGGGGIASGNNSSGFYGSNRGPGGLGGGYGRRPSDYYDMHGRDEDYSNSNKRDGAQNTHPAPSSAFTTGPGGYSVDSNSSTSPSNTRRI